MQFGASSWAGSSASLIFAPTPANDASPKARAGVLIDGPSGQRLLTTKEAAERLGLSHRTLEGLRSRGGGPAFVALSRNIVRYRADVLDAWVASREAPHTAKSRAILAAAA